MNCEYKLKKYRIKYFKQKKNLIYFRKYNFYKNLVGGFTCINKIYIIALKSFIDNYNESV